MKAINNAAYYVPYVKLREDFKPYLGETLKKGDEFPVHLENSNFNFDPEQVEIMVHGKYFCNIHKIPLEKVKMFVKVIRPKFKLGQVVKNVGSRNGGFRIYRYTIIQGKVWYMDGWCVATGYQSGCHEDDLILADEEKADVDYYDSLMQEKQPSIYNAIMRK